jgi:hypothetical protein
MLQLPPRPERAWSGMDRKTAISTAALVILGAAVGLVWKKVQVTREAAREEEQQHDIGDRPGRETPSSMQGSATGAASASTGELLRALAPPVRATPEELQKRAATVRRLMETYPDAAERLGLSPEQATAFFELQARQQVELSEITSRVVEADLVRRLQLSAQAEQRAALGEKYADWEQYQQEQLDRNPVDRLQTILGAQGNPLPDDQVNRMIDDLTAEQSRITRELVDASKTHGQDEREMLELQLQRAALDNRRLVTAASRHLGAQQLEIYEQVLQQQVEGLRKKLKAMDQETGE